MSRSNINGAVMSERAQSALVSPANVRAGGMHAGMYDVTCHNVRDLLPLLARSDRVGDQWRTTHGDPLRAAVARKIISLDEIRSLLKWQDTVRNLLVNTGRDEYLNRLWKASSYTAAHFVGLIDGTTPTIAAADTMSSHSGWTEFTEYSTTSGNRPSLTSALGSVASQSLASSAIAFLVNSNGLDCNGAFTTTSAQVGASGGTLITAGTFTQGNKSVDSGDLLNVTLTFTMAAA
jgi:hypothetical protein